MKKILIIPLCLFLALFSRGQSLSSSVIGSTGEQFANGSGSLEWTLGEIMTETYQQSMGFFTQGFQQPATIRVTSLEENKDVNFFVFPNPTQDILFVKTFENGEFLFELFDMQGQKLVNKNSGEVTGIHLHQIDLQEFKVAVYLLHITNTTNGNKTYHKIEKL